MAPYLSLGLLVLSALAGEIASHTTTLPFRRKTPPSPIHAAIARVHARRARAAPLAHAVLSNSHSNPFSRIGNSTATARSSSELDRGRTRRQVMLQRCPGHPSNLASTLGASRPPKPGASLRKAGSKGGSKSFRRLAQSSTDFESCFDVIYYGEVSLGTPGETLQVILDTGSADLWVFGGQCHNCPAGINKYHHGASSTYHPDGTAFAIQYADGDSVQGSLSKDVLGWGGFQVQEQYFAEIISAQGFSIVCVEDGLLGMAFDDLANSKKTTPFHMLVQSGQLSAPVFGFFLTHEGMGGELTLGGTDQAHYQGELAWVPLSTPTYGFWELPLQYISGGGVHRAVGQTAIMDTGTTFIVGPDAAAQHLIADVGATCYFLTNAGDSLVQQACTNTNLQFYIGLIPCGSGLASQGGSFPDPPSMDFAFSLGGSKGGVTFSLEVDDYALSPAPCPAGYFMDCAGNCIEDCGSSCGDQDPGAWLGDGECDDGAYGYFYNCPALGCDGGDCAGSRCSMGEPGEVCQLGVEPGIDDNYWIFGDVFLRKVYSAYNYPQHKVGLAYSSLASLQVPSPAPTKQPAPRPTPRPSADPWAAYPVAALSVELALRATSLASVADQDAVRAGLAASLTDPTLQGGEMTSFHVKSWIEDSAAAAAAAASRQLELEPSSFAEAPVAEAAVLLPEGGSSQGSGAGRAASGVDRRLSGAAVVALGFAAVPEKLGFASAAGWAGAVQQQLELALAGGQLQANLEATCATCLPGDLAPESLAVSVDGQTPVPAPTAPVPAPTKAKTRENPTKVPNDSNGDGGGGDANDKEPANSTLVGGGKKGAGGGAGSEPNAGGVAARTALVLSILAALVLFLTAVAKGLVCRERAERAKAHFHRVASNWLEPTTTKSPQASGLASPKSPSGGRSAAWGGALADEDDEAARVIYEAQAAASGIELAHTPHGPPASSARAPASGPGAGRGTTIGTLGDGAASKAIYEAQARQQMNPLGGAASPGGGDARAGGPSRRYFGLGKDEEEEEEGVVDVPLGLSRPNGDSEVV